MHHEITTLPLVRLHSNVPCATPDPRLTRATEQDPAVRVMTDFNRVVPITVEPAVGIDNALQRMKDSGVRLLLVTDARDNIQGIITSYDIQGDKPIRLSEEARLHRSRISVSQIMMPLEEVPAFDYAFVQQSLVRHVVNTMRSLRRQHALVVEEHAGAQRLRGMFSTTQISKTLGIAVQDLMQPAPSLAEMQLERTHY